MEALLLLGTLVVLLVALDVLAHLCGCDSREGIDGDEPRQRVAWLDEAERRQERIMGAFRSLVHAK